MYAEEIIQLDLDDVLVLKRLEIYECGINSGKHNYINFILLKENLEPIWTDEEAKILEAEFIKGYIDGLT